jgi:hypothetical protein
MPLPYDDASVLNALQRWYAAECNGDWEHSYGIVIETLDNPGWSVQIDLEETQLACRARPQVREQTSEEDWIHVEITDSKFVGAGDPTKLLTILAAFIEFKNSAEAEKATTSPGG